MKRVIRANTYLVDQADTTRGDKSIKLPIRRDDGTLVEHRSFPLSQISIEETGGGYLRVTIPDWLVRKNVGFGYTIK